MDSNTQGQESLPLIRTKIRAPSLSPDLVPRPHLIDRLNRGLDRKLSLVSVPAGFGKTTLVVSWLEVIDRPVAWLSLDGNDNDLFLFLSYFIGAIRRIIPAACQGTFKLIHS